MMDEKTDAVLQEIELSMGKVISHLEEELSRVRAGKASPTMLDSVMVPYYGQPTPLNQVASVNSVDGRTLAITPWEKAIIPDIETAIVNANLGFTPENNGEVIRINVPILTTERRKELSKQVKQFGEVAKVGVRQARQHANDAVKKLKKSGLSEDEEKESMNDIQKLTDKYIQKVDHVVGIKEQDIQNV